LAQLLTRGSSAFYSKMASPEKIFGRAPLEELEPERKGALPNRPLISTALLSPTLLQFF
jgi:hypothetical protein